jgi:hypothetical protein
MDIVAESGREFFHIQLPFQDYIGKKLFQLFQVVLLYPERSGQVV